MRRFRRSSLALALCFLLPPLAVAAETPKDKAWSVLYSGLSINSYEQRTTAMQVLGLLPGDAKAEEAALRGLGDQRPGKGLIDLGDNQGYNVYYAILTGERKSGTSLKDEQKKMLNDPKKMAQFGFEQGIGFIPFASMGYGSFNMGYGAFKMLTKDNTSPVLAAAALTLAKDPDPQSGQALADTAANNKSWIVRAAALNAMALRGETLTEPFAEAQLEDPKEEVRYSAAASVIRDLKRHPLPVHRVPIKPAPKNKKRVRTEAAPFYLHLADERREEVLPSFSELSYCWLRFTYMVTRLAALLIATSLLTVSAAAQQFPHVEEESLAVQKVVLPESVSGKVAVLVLGFSKASSEPTGEWAKRAQEEFSKNPGFALYQLPVIEEAPSFIRGMIISGMKKGMSDAQRVYVVPVVHQESQLKKLVNFKQPDDAYIVLLDRNGTIVYQTHTTSLDPGYAELRAKVQALLK